MAREPSSLSTNHTSDQQTIVAAIRDAFVELYPLEQDARLVVDDAGLRAALIAFSPRAQTNWHNILTEALRQQGLTSLLNVALTNYPNNPKLLAAYTQYLRWVEQGNRLSDIASLPAEGGDVQPITTDGGYVVGAVQLAQGDWVGRDKHVQGDEIYGNQNVVQVEGNAKHVAAGKNIIQIGSIKISPYLVVLSAFSLFVLTFSILWGAHLLTVLTSAVIAPTATPRPTAIPTRTPPPIPTPTATYVPLSGAVYGIVIAQFGQLDDKGNLQPTQEGSNLSQLLADRLKHAFTASIAENDFGMQFLYADLNAPSGARPIGVIADKEQAEAIRRELNAKLLIYGHLTAEKPRKLQLGFVFTTKRMETEPDAVAGYQRLGAPFVFEPAAGMEMEEFENNPELAWRTQALIWLARGLARDLVGNHAKALETFLQAAQQLKAWPNEDGKEVLYYFQGREALALLEKQGPFGLAENGQSVAVLQGAEAQQAIQAGEAHPLQRLALAESAFLTATQINPDYVAASIGLGNVYFHRSEFALLARQSVTVGMAACSPELAVAQIQTSEQLTNTLTGVIKDIDQTIKYYDTAVNKAQELAIPQVLPVAQVMRGYAHGLKGMAFILKDEEESQVEPLLQATTEPHKATEEEPQVGPLEQATTELHKAVADLNASRQPFRDQQQYGFLAFGYYGLGHAYRALAHIHKAQSDQEGEREQYQQAHENYAKCYALEATPTVDGDTDLQQIMGCYCRAWDDQMIDNLTRLGGGAG